jgi:Mrp family chromosome partitioning ATPase
MADLVERCKREYDFVIIDSAPLLGMSDTLSMGQLAESVILVIRESFTSVRALREAANTANRSRLPLIGVVMNHVDFRSHAYSYGYGYGYNYKSYFSGYFDDPKGE